jgi:hypothetical protein
VTPEQILGRKSGFLASQQGVRAYLARVELIVRRRSTAAGNIVSAAFVRHLDEAVRLGYVPRAEHHPGIVFDLDDASERPRITAESRAGILFC